MECIIIINKITKGGEVKQQWNIVEGEESNWWYYI